MGFQVFGQRQIKEGIHRVDATLRRQCCNRHSLQGGMLWVCGLAYFDVFPIAQKENAGLGGFQVLAEGLTEGGVAVNGGQFMGLSALDRVEGRVAEHHIGVKQGEVKRQGLATGQHIQGVAAVEGLRATVVVAEPQLGRGLVVHGQHGGDVGRPFCGFGDRLHDVGRGT